VALRWLLAQGVTAPIASATDLAQLQELLRAPSLTLTAQDLRTLDLASAPGAVAD
jgi:aryl-alcohol dehydrogenase-like predicted oxidoreductase